ncbi:MAG TPA: TrkH family potassium uptake protein [Paracoccaceae bacterium]|nr:TrkH family potassium uptake protein [Paracoccaceae bacterium]
MTRPFGSRNSAEKADWQPPAAAEKATGSLARDVRSAVHATAIVCCFLSAFMFVPAVGAYLAQGPGGFAFAVSGGICGLFSLMLATVTRSRGVRLSPRFGFLVVNMMWWGATLVCAVPLMLGPVDLSLVDALFESASGLTTTGSTVLVGLDSMDQATLLWRAMIQWVGGLGILSLGLILLPFLSVGGMQLFRIESSDKSEKPLPRFVQLSKAILAIYLTLSGLCLVGYLMAGMTPFDALTHMMTTLATGGYSTHDASFGYFQSSSILLVGTLFMLLGATPLTFFVALASSRQKFRLDPQIKVLVGIILGATFLVVVGRTDGADLTIYSVSAALFNVTSIITTTGFAAGDYSLWGPAVPAVFYVLTFLGGCAGSTAGGLKTYRLIVIFELVRISVQQLLHPRGVFVMRYGGRPVDPEIFRAAMVMAMAMFGSVAGGTIALGICGLDLVTALTGTMQALSNVGPGLGPIIGPAGNYANLPDSAKLVLSALMIIGRLEILAVLVLLTPVFWRD